MTKSKHKSKTSEGLAKILDKMFPGVEAEVKFMPTRKFRVDYLWRKELVALEIEGGVFTGGRHIHPSGFMSDMTKYNELALAGYMLIRVTPQMMKDGTATVLLERAFKARAT